MQWFKFALKMPIVEACSEPFQAFKVKLFAIVVFFAFLFNCYLAAARPTLGHSQGDSFTNPMLITAFVHIRPEDHREPCN